VGNRISRSGRFAVPDPPFAGTAPPASGSFYALYLFGVVLETGPAIEAAHDSTEILWLIVWQIDPSAERAHDKVADPYRVAPGYTNGAAISCGLATVAAQDMVQHIRSDCERDRAVLCCSTTTQHS